MQQILSLTKRLRFIIFMVWIDFWVNIQFKGHLVSFDYSERIYALCGSEFFKYCPMDNTINWEKK